LPAPFNVSLVTIEDTSVLPLLTDLAVGIRAHVRLKAGGSDMSNREHNREMRNRDLYEYVALNQPEVALDSSELMMRIRQLARRACVRHLVEPRLQRAHSAQERAEVAAFQRHLEARDLVAWAALDTRHTAQGHGMHDHGAPALVFTHPTPPGCMAEGGCYDATADDGVHLDDAEARDRQRGGAEGDGRETPRERQRSVRARAGDLLVFPPTLAHHVPAEWDAGAADGGTRVVFAFNLVQVARDDVHECMSRSDAPFLKCVRRAQHSEAHSSGAGGSCDAWERVDAQERRVNTRYAMRRGCMVPVVATHRLATTTMQQRTCGRAGRSLISFKAYM
jgi:hypothetical protein